MTTPLTLQLINGSKSIECSRFDNIKDSSDARVRYLFEKSPIRKYVKAHGFFKSGGPHLKGCGVREAFGD